MREQGNVAVSGVQFTIDQRAHIYSELKDEEDKADYGSIQRVRKRLREKFGITVSKNSLIISRKKYRAEGWQFMDQKRSPGGGRKRKFSDAALDEMKDQLKGSNARRVSKKLKFERRSDGKKVKVNRMTLSRLANKENLVLSQPKVKGIRVHADHHKKMRVSHAKWFLNLPDAHKMGVWYSDEIPFYIQPKPNVKNDVIFVEKGQQPSTNVHRHHKGDSSQLFSLWWTINKLGVVAVRVYTENMGVDYFQEVLRSELKPVVHRYDRSRQKLRHWYHDHVTNSSKLYDTEEMDEVFGAGRWLQFAPKICREPDGQMWIEPTAKRRGFFRAKSKAKTECSCIPTNGGAQVPSSSPDLNLAEYAQGMLRTMLNDSIRDGEEEWRGNVTKKMAVVKRLVNKLNDDKPFFRKLWDGHSRRCQKVVESEGGLT